MPIGTALTAAGAAISGVTKGVQAIGRALGIGGGGREYAFTGTAAQRAQMQQLMAISKGRALPSVSAAPAASAATTTALIASQSPSTGLTSLIPWWKGPGGGLQMPWSDPRVPEMLKAFSLDDSYLRVSYRAPRGFVVVRDAQGRPYPMQKQMARQFGLWKPAAKPPISATMWKHYKQNRHIEKKLIKIAGPALKKYGRKSAAAPSRKKR